MLTSHHIQHIENHRSIKYHTLHVLIWNNSPSPSSFGLILLIAYSLSLPLCSSMMHIFEKLLDPVWGGGMVTTEGGGEPRVAQWFKNYLEHNASGTDERALT